MPSPLPLRVGAAALALTIAALGTGDAGAGTPDFIPEPSAVFSGLTALAQPRADVPIGALWVQGYGPYGAAASPDNVETIRSLSGVSLNRETQLRLTLGIASLLNLDPGYRSRINARFSELTLLRVKDVSALAGPAGEPRIYEALKAGTITITTDSDISADLGGSISAAGLPVLGRGDNGRLRSFTIDGKDMFIAFRVVTPRNVRGKAQEAKLKSGESVKMRVLDYEIVADAAAAGKCRCGAAAQNPASACDKDPAVTVAVMRSGSRGAAGGEASKPHLLDDPPASLLDLPVPVSDGHGGLYTSVAVEADFGAGGRSGRKGAADQCSSPVAGHGRLTVTPVGSRLETLERPQSKGW